MTNDLQKRCLLLHVTGMEVQEVYFMLVGEDTIATFQDTLKVLDDYFIQKANVPFERHLFRQIAQENSETRDQFVCRLCQRSVSCDFGEQEDDLKCCSSHMRLKLLEKEGTLTLEDLLRIARSQEAVDRQMKVMVSNAGANQINVVGGNKRSARSRVCYACGLDGHFSGNKWCPAHGQACLRCGGIGHFRVRCPKVMQRGSGELRGTTSSGRNGPSRGMGVARGDKAGARSRFQSKPVKPREANRVLCQSVRQQPSSPVQQSPEYAFSVERPGDLAVEKSGSVSLVVGGVHLGEVLIDSGATCNVLSEPTWNFLKQRGIRCESRKSATTLYPYGGKEPLPTLGTFTADVMLAGDETGCRADFVVVKGDSRTLLGRGTAMVLDILRVGPAEANSVSRGLDGDIRRRYSALFNGVGRLKGYELKLHIEDSVKPVAQHVRRIPLGLREKVEKKLDELLELDIIEGVPEGPSGWISPLVVVPKSDGDVRVCVDNASCQ